MKARLKSIVISALSTLFAFTAITYSSCTSDKCKSINCAYGGVCKNGSCVCQTGYEGTECEILTKTKYIGSWNVKEKGTLEVNSSAYTLTIKDGGSVNQLAIQHFYNAFTSDVTAYVAGDTIVIPTQTVDGSTVQGHGYIVSESTADHYFQHAQITMYYSVTTSGVTDDFGLASGTPSLWQH